MDDSGMTLERLRQALADLESRQRATGSAAAPDFFDPPRGGPEPAHGSRAAAEPGSGRAGAGDAAVPAWGARVAAGTGRLARVFALLTAATERPTGEPATLAQDDLFESVAQLGRLQQAREIALVRLLTELETRAAPSPGGLSRADWLRSTDPTLTAGQARAIATTAAALAQPRWQHLAATVTNPGAVSSGTDSTGTTDPADPADPADSADQTDPGGLHAGGVTVGKAAQIIDFHTRLHPVADPDELDQAITDLTDQAPTLRPEELARLARLLSDQLRPPPDLDDLDQARRTARGLWFSPPNTTGMVHLRGLLDPEGAAIVTAAIDPLSAPRPLTDATGHLVEPDPHPAPRRRADALLEALTRGVSAPGAGPSTDKAKVIITIDLATLLADLHHHTTRTIRPTTGPTSGVAARTGPRGGGVCQFGHVLSPATARRIACDARIIPVVLGSASQPLDVGREGRLVTRALRTALWLRDRGCTFPGCTVPAAWTDAHHVQHWLHGGTTCLTNLALLCRRHHTHVHDRGLTATVTETTVTWRTWQHSRPSGHPPAHGPVGSQTGPEAGCTPQPHPATARAPAGAPP